MIKIFHILPQNIIPCGGVKVHYQLSELEMELGYDSYIAMPNPEDPPTWFKHSCRVISHVEVQDICKEDDIIIGYEDPLVLKNFKTRKKVCYIQGEVFFRKDVSYDNFTLWFSSYWNRKKVVRVGNFVSPFIDPDVFPFTYKNFNVDKFQVLVQERKKGKDKWYEITKYLKSVARDMTEIKILPNVSEKEFSKALRESHIFFAHSYPEGLGLPSLEAMSTGTLVFGFSGGGGTDFMVNSKNCFCARDGNFKEATSGLLQILIQEEEDRNLMIAEARQTVKKYSRELTKLQLTNALEMLNES